jgi:hypothetical protein
VITQERKVVHDQQIKALSHLQKPNVVIGTVLPCGDLKQRLRKIYDIAITRYEKKQALKNSSEEEKD